MPKCSNILAHAKKKKKRYDDKMCRICKCVQYMSLWIHFNAICYKTHTYNIHTHTPHNPKCHGIIIIIILLYWWENLVLKHICWMEGTDTMILYIYITFVFNMCMRENYYIFERFQPKSWKIVLIMIYIINWRR